LLHQLLDERQVSVTDATGVDYYAAGLPVVSWWRLPSPVARRLLGNAVRALAQADCFDKRRALLKSSINARIIY